MKESVNNPIAVKDLFQKLWNQKNVFIIVWIVTIVVVGAGTYLIPRKWQSSTMIVPEYNLEERLEMQKILSELSTEIRVGASGDAISPMLYGEVIQDARFLEELSQQEVKDKKGRTYPIATLYPKAECKEKMYEEMREDIQCKLSRKNESILLSAKAKDPLVAQQIAVLTCQQLATYLTNYRTEKAQRNLTYYQQLSNSSPVAARMYEMAKIRLEEHQPSFVVIQEAEVPIRTIAPQRIKIVSIAWLLVTLGMVVWYWRKDISEWL